MNQTFLKISPQGQITIPKQWRKTLNMNKGTKMIARLEHTPMKSSLILTKEPDNWIEAIAGTGKGLWGKDINKYINTERDSWK